MQSQVTKGLVLLGILLYLLYGFPAPGNALAASFNGNVKECIDHPKQCQKQLDGKSESGAKQSETANPAVTFGDIARMILALIFVICLLYFVLKFVNKRSRAYQSSKMIQNFGGTPLGGNKSLQIVKAGDRILILGVGDDVQLVKEIDDEEEVRQFVDRYNKKLEQQLEPRDIATRLIKAVKNRETGAKTEATPFGHLLKSQISAIREERAQAMKELEQREKEKQNDE